MNLLIEGVHNSIAFVECTATMNFRVFYLPTKQTPYSLSVTPNYQFCFPPKTQQPCLSTFYFYSSAYSRRFIWRKQNNAVFLSGFLYKTCVQGSSVKKQASPVHSSDWVHSLSALQSVSPFSSWWIVRLLPLLSLWIRLGWAPSTSFWVSRHFRFSSVRSKINESNSNSIFKAQVSFQKSCIHSHPHQEHGRSRFLHWLLKPFLIGFIYPSWLTRME